MSPSFSPSGGISLPPGPGGPPEGQMCKIPPDCPASCEFCSKAQFGPSDTTLWSESYLHGHTLIGTKWNGENFDPDPVNFEFNIPKWDGTCEGTGKVPGCKFQPCQVSDPNCEETVCGYGRIDCARTHDRVIDIYNEVPFLASVWDQAFEADGGVERSCYNKCLR